MKQIFISPDVYPVKVLVLVGPWDESFVRRTVAKRFPGLRPLARPGPDAAGSTYANGNAAIIWMPRFPRTPFDHGMLAHEALHAASHFGGYLGLKFKEASEEFYTYMVGYIVEQTHRKFRK